MSAELRVGIGFDIHKLVAGRRLVLGGIDVPYHLGLEGHSDADVIAHAIMDALLGAAALGDIGHYFPPSDAQWSAADSMDLLRRVHSLLTRGQWAVVNVDCAVVAEAPRLSPYLPAMRARIAQSLGAEPSCVGVKVTTAEGLGTEGRGESISARAVALIQRVSTAR